MVVLGGGLFPMNEVPLYYTARQNILAMATALKGRVLSLTGRSETTLLGNFVPRISQLTQSENSWLAVCDG